MRRRPILSPRVPAKNVPKTWNAVGPPFIADYCKKQSLGLKKTTYLPGSNQNVVSFEKVSKIRAKLGNTEDRSTSIVVKTAASDNAHAVYDPKYGPWVPAKRFRDRLIMRFGVEQMCMKGLFSRLRVLCVFEGQLFGLNRIGVRCGGRHIRNYVYVGPRMWDTTIRSTAPHIYMTGTRARAVQRFWTT